MSPIDDDDGRILTPRARELLTADDATRTAYIQSDRFIKTPGTIEILARLEEEFARPRVLRQPGVFIQGVATSGKSAIIKKFLRDHPTVRHPDAEVDEVPLISVELDSARVSKFLTKLGKAFASPLRPRNEDMMHSHIDACFERIQPRMLIIDEVQGSGAGSPMERVKLWSLIKGYVNRYQLSLVLAGTADARSTIAQTPELTSRIIYQCDMPTWVPGSEWDKFLIRVEATLPLGKASNLSRNNAVSQRILSWSGGLTGKVICLVRDAAVLAIKDEDKKITLALINRAISRYRAEEKAA